MLLLMYTVCRMPRNRSDKFSVPQCDCDCDDLLIGRLQIAGLSRKVLRREINLEIRKVVQEAEGIGTSAQVWVLQGGCQDVGDHVLAIKPIPVHVEIDAVSDRT